MKLLPHVVVHWEGRLPAVLLLGDRIAWAKGTSFRQDGIRAGLGRRRALARWYAWLVREPGNPHDPNAIAIYLAQTHVGYVPRTMAVSLAPQLDAVRAAAQIEYVSALCTIRRADHGALVVGIIGPWPFDESTSEGWRPRSGRRRKGEDDDEGRPYDEELDEDER